MTHRTIGALVTSAALLGFGLVTAPPASAATSCYAASCNGLNPAATICQNDARTVAESGDPMGAMELRYSPTCRAAWGRFKISTPYGSRIEIKNTLGSKYTTYGNGKFYSFMVNDKDIQAWACGMWPSEFGGTNTACTTGY